MPVVQCPRCPLRFDLAPMLADHLRTDHGMDPADTAHLQPAAARVGLLDARRAAKARDAREERTGREPVEDGVAGGADDGVADGAEDGAEDGQR